MAKKYKIAVVGHFAFGQNCADGQTIKTQNLYRALTTEYGDKEITCLDTFGYKKHILSFILSCFRVIANCQNIIILPAHNGVKVFVPLFVVLNIFFKRKLHYDVIGGWLSQFLEKRKWLVFFAKKLDSIFVETSSMKETLDQRGFKNVVVVPNFKFITPLSLDELVYSEKPPYKLCTFSRVSKEKGIEDAVRVVREINEESENTLFELDIYGQVDSDYVERFEKLKADFPAYINYKGVVDSEKSVEILKDYFALLFPTVYEGEGFAGTLIDALSAGIPIIATNWRYNSEIVNRDCGFLVSLDNTVDDIKKALSNLTCDMDRVKQYKLNCLTRAKEYIPEKAILCLCEQLNK